MSNVEDETGAIEVELRCKRCEQQSGYYVAPDNWPDDIQCVGCERNGPFEVVEPGQVYFQDLKIGDIPLHGFEQVQYTPPAENGYEPPDGHYAVGENTYVVEDGDVADIPAGSELVNALDTDTWGREVESEVFDAAAVVEAAGYDPDEVDLAHLNDREKAYGGYSLIEDSDDYYFLATGDGQLYQFDDGVWTPDGEQGLREIGTKLFQQEWGSNLLREMIEQVRSRSFVPREELGAPSQTIATASGLLDLTTGEVRDANPRLEYPLNKVPVEWDPDAEAPRWDRFLEESVEDGRKQAVEEYIGYSLLEGEMPFARALLLVGGGSNGKSTLLNTVVDLLGQDNVTGFSLGDLSHDQYYVAQMYGALANIDADVTGGIGHGGMFKKLTGGDRKVSGRHPYGEPFDFHPTTKQLYAANEVPDAKVDDDAFFRRWLIVEFPREFTDPQIEGPDKDPQLQDKLKDELPGILRRAVEALQRLLEQGHFTNEGEIYEKRQRWQAWGDTVDKFISNYVETDGDSKMQTGELYDYYAAFCRQELGEKPESQSTLTGRMKKQDGVKYSNNFRFDGKKGRGFKGLRVTFDLEDIEGDGDPQMDLNQADRMERVLAVIRTHEGQTDGLVAVDEVLEALESQIRRESAEQAIERLLAKGQIMEPENGKIRTT